MGPTLNTSRLKGKTNKTFLAEVIEVDQPFKNDELSTAIPELQDTEASHYG